MRCGLGMRMRPAWNESSLNTSRIESAAVTSPTMPKSVGASRRNRMSELNSPMRRKAMRSATMTIAPLAIYRPLVSIVVPMFNAALTIERALRSIEAQSYPNWEAIFIDDASEDEGARYVAAAESRDRRIRLIRLDLNGGPARARNLGISACRGELVAFLAADDEWLPEKLARQVAPFGADTGLSLVVADMQVTDVAGAAGSSVYARQAPVQGAEAWRTLLGSSFVATSVATKDEPR